MNPRTDIRPKERNSGNSGISPVDAEVDSQASESEGGQRQVAKLPEPRLPSDEDVKLHQMTHLPYRNWCEHCIRGRGKEMSHTRNRETPATPEVHFDFAFMGEQDTATIPILVVRETRTKMTLMTAMASKTPTTWTIERVVTFLREIGLEHTDVIVKSDQEPTIKKLVDEVGHARNPTTSRWIVESSPVGSHASNGIVERAIQSVQAQARVMKSALEERWGCNISPTNPVISWLMEYSAVLLNNFEVGKDGFTAYERLKKKKSKTLGLEYGEELLWKRRDTGGNVGKWHHLGIESVSWRNYCWYANRCLGHTYCATHTGKQSMETGKCDNYSEEHLGLRHSEKACASVPRRRQNGAHLLNVARFSRGAFASKR